MTDLTENQNDDNSMSYEVAEDEFFKLCKAWDINTNPQYMDADDLENFEGLKMVVMLAIQEGRLVVEDNNHVTLSLKNPVGQLEEIKFKEPDGGMYAAGDRLKATETGKRYNAMIGYLIGQPVSVVNRLKTGDIKTAQAIMNLFVAL